MKPLNSSDSIDRRAFLQGVSATAALAAASIGSQSLAAEPPKAAKIIGIQVGSISFLDEGVDQVLDNLQQMGNVNTIFLATFTYGRGIAGRQIPGQPLPDHGTQQYDQDTFHGGNYATPHPAFYEKTALKQTKAPDFGPDYDVLAQVLPPAQKHGIPVYSWYADD